MTGREIVPDLSTVEAAIFLVHYADTALGHSAMLVRFGEIEIATLANAFWRGYDLGRWGA